MKTEDIQRAIAGGNKVLAEAMKNVDSLKQDLARVCPTPKKRIRQSSKPLMNKLEQEFFDKIRLEHPDCAPYIRPQSMRFRLANGLWFKPDITCSWGLSSRAWEVKGPHSFRGGFENLKMAATTYPEWIWSLVWKENGEWLEQVVLA